MTQERDFIKHGVAIKNSESQEVSFPAFFRENQMTKFAKKIQKILFGGYFGPILEVSGSGSF